MKLKNFDFFYIARELNKKFIDSKIESIEYGKNTIFIYTSRENLLCIYGKHIAILPYKENIRLCRENKHFNYCNDYIIKGLNQLFLDRVIDIKLVKKDSINEIERHLIVLFTGRLSTIVTDSLYKITYTSDKRYRIDTTFSIDNMLPFYEKLSLGQGYKGSNILELIHNIENNLEGSGDIEIESIEELKHLLESCDPLYKFIKGNEIEVICYDKYGKTNILEILSEFLNDFLIEEKKYCQSIITKRINKQIQKKSKLIENINKYYNTNEQKYIDWANAIMFNKHRIRKGESEVVLRYYNNEGEIQYKIKLKTELSPESNAQYYYDKAENIKQKRRRAIIRRDKLKKEINNLNEKIKVLQNGSESLCNIWATDSTIRRTVHKKGFKYFKLKSGSIVYVGRNNKENDELTLHFSNPRDLFFHVREAPGSHVILRYQGENPLPADIEKTASIAAYFSKMRNSTLVPISYTEIRYVRKPRKTKSGTVVLTREKVIFVSPKIPSN